jgi:hypothetical protein
MRKTLTSTTPFEKHDLCAAFHTPAALAANLANHFLPARTD